MAGPACVVLFPAVLDGDALDCVDSILAGLAERIDRTRKGRVWDVWIGGRSIHVAASVSDPELLLSAGCNSREDYDILTNLANSVASALGGVAGEPIK